jgi:hypothetical protein
VCLVGDVAGHRVDRGSPAELVGDGGQPRLTAGVDDQLPAVGGEGTGEREAESP